MIIIAIVVLLFPFKSAKGQTWECKDGLTGRATITNAPVQNENLTCLVVKNDGVAFNKLDSQFFEAYIKEAEDITNRLLSLSALSGSKQEQKNDSKESNKTRKAKTNIKCHSAHLKN